MGTSSEEESEERDAFLSSPASSLLGVASTSGHKPTLTQLISTADLPTLASPNDAVQLPTAPPLSHGLFSGADFEPSRFLLSRRHTGLEELRGELRAYLATLRSSLVAVINEEYESFIGLSLGLRRANVGPSLAAIRRPVLSIRAEVATVKGELDAMKREMEVVLKERQNVRESKAMLRRLLETEEQVEKVEALLKLGDAPGRHVNGAKEVDRTGSSPAKRLGRIAAEYSQMQYLVQKAGPDLPFIRTLSPRIARITSTLQLDLSTLLTSTLTSPPPSPQHHREALVSLFNTYASLSLHKEAADVFRRSIVRPFIVSTIRHDSLTSPPTSTSPSPHPPPSDYHLEPLVSSAPFAQPLASLYNTLLAFVAKECGLVLEVTEPAAAPSPGGTAFNLLTDVLWEEISTRLVSELGSSLFAAGRPGVFHQNYTLTTAFISRLETLCPSLTALSHFRSSPSTASFLRRFQLPVYFQLRFKEIVTSVERAILVGGAASEEGTGTFRMAESEAVWMAINYCWSDEVCIEELKGKFWKLSLQLVSRYRTWLNASLPKYVLPVSQSTTNLSTLSAGTPPSRSSFDGSRDKGVQSASNSRPGTPQNEELSEEQTLRQLTLLVADATLMERKLTELWTASLKSQLPIDDEDDADQAARDVWKASLSQITSILPSLSSQIVTILTKRCADNLKHVRAVVSQVRASTRKGPAEPSFFVANVLKDLKTYSSGPGKIVDDDLRREWAEKVVEEIASRYAAILANLHKQTDSLRWLKKGRQGLSFFSRGGAEEPGQEDDKVKQQMALDIDALAKDAEELGVNVATSKAWEELRRANEEAGKAVEGK